jgi:hypothetical protein
LAARPIDVALELGNRPRRGKSFQPLSQQALKLMPRVSLCENMGLEFRKRSFELDAIARA